MLSSRPGKFRFSSSPYLSHAIHPFQAIGLGPLLPSTCRLSLITSYLSRSINLSNSHTSRSSAHSPTHIFLDTASVSSTCFEEPAGQCYLPVRPRLAYSYSANELCDIRPWHAPRFNQRIFSTRSLPSIGVVSPIRTSILRHCYHQDRLTWLM